jgi:excisionase family DNA binding protein
LSEDRQGSHLVDDPGHLAVERDRGRLVARSGASVEVRVRAKTGGQLGISLPVETKPPSDRSDGVAPRLCTAQQAAAVLSISRSKLYELMARGEIETVHIGRSVRIPLGALDDFVARLRDDRAS